ncbi:MAG TPA: adenosylmethionine decarboxylase [Actinomycetota bacterium]|nr:adenosylmethionine decarboxylase [Actinomycetota bacterium]
MKALGRHLIIEMWEAENLNSAQALEQGLKEAVAAIDGTLLDVRVVEFPVHGVTGVAIIAESHVAVHTWPEYGYAAVDVFTCNLESDIHAGVAALSRHLLPGRVEVREISRGQIPEDLARQHELRLAAK